MRFALITRTRRLEPLPTKDSQAAKGRELGFHPYPFSTLAGPLAIWGLTVSRERWVQLASVSPRRARLFLISISLIIQYVYHTIE